MAINKLKTEIKSYLDKISKDIGGGSGGNYYYGSPTLTEVTFKGSKFIESYTKVTESIIKGMATVNPGITIVTKYNTPYQWKKALANAVAHIQSANGLQVKTKFIRFEKAGTMVDNSSVEPTLNTGVFADELSSTQLRLVIVRKQGNKQAEDIFKALKDLVWNMWVEIVNDKLHGTSGVHMPSADDYGQRHSMSSKDPATGKKVPGGRVIGLTKGVTVSNLLSGGGVKASHTADTSSWLETLRRFKNKAPALSASHLISTHDLAKDVEKGLKVGYARQRLKKKTGGYTQVNFISLDIATNPGERTDIKELKKRMVEAIDDRIKAAQDKGLIISPKDESSKSFNNAVAEDAIIDMLIPLTKKGSPDKRFKIVKNLSAKKFKQLKDDITIMTGGGIKPVPKMVSMRASGKTIEKTKPAEKGQESQQVDLLRLKSVINKRLPAEVRRNMGKPALTNRTSNFSNSAELLRLKYTRAGISGDYTYTKSGGGSRPPQPGVYQTFENSGRWPAGYNPKDLITKSIRNLATQYTQERFVQLRRR